MQPLYTLFASEFRRQLVSKQRVN